MKRPTRVVALAALVCAAASLAACDPLSSFQTEADEAYCGSITLGSAYRAGLSPRVQMRLDLDVAALEGEGSPGRISTYDAGLDTGARLLEDAPLRPIAPLANDPLSQLEFGDGRERNLIYAVGPSDPSAEGILAFVSLRSDDSVEVRLLRPGREAADSSARGPMFGLFTLRKQPGDCGF